MLENILVYMPSMGYRTKTVDTDTYRSKILEARNIIIKFGSLALLNGNGELNEERMRGFAEQMIDLQNKGYRVTVVSSGARVAGEDYVGREGMTKRALCIAGQPDLMVMWKKVFGNEVPIGQILMMDYDFQPRRRGVVKAGFDEFYNGCRGIAIVNANDATWTGETEQDNDRLKASLCKLLGVDFVLTISTVNGLKKDYGTEEERLVNWVYDVDTALKDSVSEGMGPKLTASREIIRQGKHEVIANAERDNIILDVVVAAKNEGTWFYKPQRNQ